MQDREFHLENKIAEIKAREEFEPDSRTTKKKVRLDDDLKAVYIDTVEKGLEACRSRLEFYLVLGRLLTSEAVQKIKKKRIYTRSLLPDIGISKSTAKNITKLYKRFGEDLGRVFDRIPVRKLVIVCACKNFKGDRLVNYCLQEERTINALGDQALRLHLTGKTPPPKPEPLMVDGYKIRVSGDHKSLTISWGAADEDRESELVDRVKRMLENGEQRDNALPSHQLTAKLDSQAGNAGNDASESDSMEKGHPTPNYFDRSLPAIIPDFSKDDSREHRYPIGHAAGPR